MKIHILREYIRSLLETEKDSLLLDEEPEESYSDISEFSGVGGVAGHMASPLEKERK